MQEVSAKSPVAIAFDEELIGIDVDNEGEKLLKFTKPTYIIIKPTLIGGFSKASRWIQLATKQQIGWWATSALESNVGLNAIAQWISTQKVTVHQGLGTGQLFKNNIHSPLSVQGGLLYFDKTRLWAY